MLVELRIGAVKKQTVAEVFRAAVHSLCIQHRCEVEVVWWATL